MNKIFKKRQIILPVLVVMLAAAIYINWQFGGQKATSDSVNSVDKNLGKAEYVNADVSSKSEQEIYFSKARTDRENARKDAVAELEEIKSNVKSSEQQKNDADAKQIKIASAVETEANIETLVKGKGFKECIAVVSDGTVNIVVLADKLESADILQIQDIVMSQIEVPLDKIKVINVE